MARLDRLALASEVAELGATLGRMFTYELLQAVSLGRGDVMEAPRRLVEAELLYQRGYCRTTHLFKHVLIQETAYQSLLNEQKTAIPRADCARTEGRSAPLRPSPSCWRITTRRQGC